MSQEFWELREVNWSKTSELHYTFGHNQHRGHKWLLLYFKIKRHENVCRV